MSQMLTIGPHFPEGLYKAQDSKKGKKSKEKVPRLFETEEMIQLVTENYNLISRVFNFFRETVNGR